VSGFDPPFNSFSASAALGIRTPPSNKVAAKATNLDFIFLRLRFTTVSRITVVVAAPKRGIALDEAYIVPVLEGASVKRPYRRNISSSAATQAQKILSVQNLREQLSQEP
jgi:hypothetical protein